MEAVLFFIAAAFAVGGALAVVLTRNPFFSVLALVVHLIALAVLFLLLHAEFLAAAQLIVYAGAVMVLYVFVVSYIGGVDEPLGGSSAARRLAPVFGGALLAVLALALGGAGLKALDGDGAAIDAEFGGPAALGELLLTKFLMPFEIASYLLTIAAVAAVMLARRRRGLEAADDPAPAPEAATASGGGPA